MNTGHAGAAALVMLALGCGNPSPPQPAPGSDSSLTRVALGSCVDQELPQPIWEAVRASEPDLLVLLGDNVYADGARAQELRRAYAKLDAQVAFAKLRSRIPVLGTWDDHDYGLNDGGAEYPLRHESEQEFLRFFRVPKTAPRRARVGVYDSVIFGEEGRRLQIILLDTRSFRSSLVRKPQGSPIPGRYVPGHDPQATILGDAQWQWLAAELRTPAEVRLIATSIQLIPEDHGWEGWALFPTERRRLLALLRDAGAQAVLLISGDRHLGEISSLDPDDGPGYRLWELTSSALNKPGGGSDDEPNRHRHGDNYRLENFGIIDIDWAANDPEIRLELRAIDGSTVRRQSFALSTIRRP